MTAQGAMVSSTQYSACSSSTWHRSSPGRRGVVIQLCVRSGSHHQAHGGVLLLLLLGYADNDTLVPAPNILSVSCSHHSHHNNTIQHSSYLRNRTGTVKLRSIWLWFTPPLLTLAALSSLSSLSNNSGPLPRVVTERKRSSVTENRWRECNCQKSWYL